MDAQRIQLIGVKADHGDGWQESTGNAPSGAGEMAKRHISGAPFPIAKPNQFRRRQVPRPVQLGPIHNGITPKQDQTGQNRAVFGFQAAQNDTKFGWTWFISRHLLHAARAR